MLDSIVNKGSCSSLIVGLWNCGIMPLWHYEIEGGQFHNGIMPQCHNDRQDRRQRTKDLAEERFARSSLHPLSSVFCPLSSNSNGMLPVLPISSSNDQLTTGNIGIGNTFTLATFCPALWPRRGAGALDCGTSTLSRGQMTLPQADCLRLP